jgi:hypothetical protein
MDDRNTRLEGEVCVISCAMHQFPKFFGCKSERPTSKEYLGGGKIMRELWKEIGALQDAKKSLEFNLET